MVLALLASLAAPPTQTLHTLRPTPSTISFTVSTRPVRTSLAAKLLHHVGLLTRMLLGLSTLAVVWTKHQLSRGVAPPVLLWALGGPQTTWVLRAIAGVGWLYMIPGALVALYLVLRRGYTEESLTLLRGLGLQTSTSPPTYLQSPRTRFLPTTQVQDLFIHEAFRGFEVRFYLAIVVKGEEDVVVVFPKLLPRRAMLEDVWRGARACLWEGAVKS
ncbi:GPI-GlcNAc transferase complex [Stagonosporopsis vannaccii]|nr:GPI-GlcNAc transferase complex [Stagonosporopsis vannaccii]